MELQQAGNASSSCSGVAMRVLSSASRSRAMTRSAPASAASDWDAQPTRGPARSGGPIRWKKTWSCSRSGAGDVEVVLASERHYRIAHRARPCDCARTDERSKARHQSATVFSFDDAPDEER